MRSEILGIGGIRQKFAGLQKDTTRMARVMVVAGGQVLKKAAREKAVANGSRITGAMIKNIVIKRETNAPAGMVLYHLGVRHGRDLTKKQKSAGKRLAVNGRGRIVVRYVDDPYYWRWVELGHKTVRRASGSGTTGTTTYQQRLRNGKVVTRKRNHDSESLRQRRRAGVSGQVAAKPFIGAAVDIAGGAAIAAMEARLDKEIAKAASA